MIGGKGLDTMLMLHTSANAPAALENGLVLEVALRAFGMARRINVVNIIEYIILFMILTLGTVTGSSVIKSAKHRVDEWQDSFRQ